MPILDPASVVGNKTIGLTLSQPTGGAVIGSPSTAVLTVLDTVGPTVTSVNYVRNRQGIILALVGTFSEPLNATTATNLVNYGYSVRTAGNDHIFGTGDDLLIPILVARYDATTSSVTLPLRRGIHPPTPFQFTIDQSTNVAGAGVGVADVVGNLLNGANNGSPGSPFAIVLSGRTGPYIASQASTQSGRRTLHASAHRTLHARARLAHPKAHLARALSTTIGAQHHAHRRGQ